MKRLLSVFLAVVMIAGLLCTGALAEDDHKREPETPGTAVSDMDSDKAAIRVRVNGSWYGTYVQDYKGQTSVWVAVNLDISKLNANTVNYFNFSSNVINQGDYTDSSVDLFASKAAENLNSFACAHQYCDSQFTQYTDRNINVRLELFDGSGWVTATPQEETYYDFHEVLGLSNNDNQWHNAARNLPVGSLDGYTAARMMVQLHVGSKLAVPDTFAEKSFAKFLPSKYTVTVTAEANTGTSPVNQTLTITLAGSTKTVPVTLLGTGGEGSGTYTLIDNLSNLTAGTFLMAGFRAKGEAQSGSTTEPNPAAEDYYGVWTGEMITGNGKTDCETLQMTFANGELTKIDANVTNSPAEMELVAVDGKSNTYYIKCNGQYLASGSKSRSLSLGADPAEWVFSMVDKDGESRLVAANGGCSLQTVDSSFKTMIRGYQSATQGKHGIYFFKKN